MQKTLICLDQLIDLLDVVIKIFKCFQMIHAWLNCDLHLAFCCIAHLKLIKIWVFRVTNLKVGSACVASSLAQTGPARTPSTT